MRVSSKSVPLSRDPLTQCRQPAARKQGNGQPSHAVQSPATDAQCPKMSNRQKKRLNPKRSVRLKPEQSSTQHHSRDTGSNTQIPPQPPPIAWDFRGIERRMRNIEDCSSRLGVIPASSPWIMRLDGCSFAGLTQHLHKPFDVQFLKTMIRTSNDLVTKFSATSAYTQSDEISLVFRASDAQQSVNFRGRTSKLLSLIAGYASARFNHHLRTYVAESGSYSTAALKAASSGEIFFDNRLLVCDDPEDVWRYFVWRSIGDCQRHAISSFAQKLLCGTGKGERKILNGMKQSELLSQLRKAGVDWEHIPAYVKHGVWCKHVQRHVPIASQHDRWRSDGKGFAVRRAIGNFTCDLWQQHQAERDWILQRDLGAAQASSICGELGLSDADIWEVAPGKLLLPPVLTSSGELVFGEQVASEVLAPA